MRVLVPAEQPRHGRDVLADGHVREEADLLDHVADAAPQLDDGEVAHAAPVDPDVAGVERDQAVDHLQRGRLAAARRADEHAERARPGSRATARRSASPRRGPRTASSRGRRRSLRPQLLSSWLLRIPAMPITPPAPTSSRAVIPIARRKPVHVELVPRARDSSADDRDAEQPRDARDRVVDAARDAGVALAGVGEHRRGERRDDHRQPDREHDQRGAAARPSTRSRASAGSAISSPRRRSAARRP